MTGTVAKIVVDGNDDKVVDTIKRVIESTLKENNFEVEVLSTKRNRSIEHIFKRCNKKEKNAARKTKTILSLGSHLDVLALNYSVHKDLGVVGSVDVDVPWELLRTDVKNFKKFYDAYTACDTIILVGKPKTLFKEDVLIQVGL